jgi:hypothetical protein
MISGISALDWIPADFDSHYLRPMTKRINDADTRCFAPALTVDTVGGGRFILALNKPSRFRFSASITVSTALFAHTI